MLQLEHSNSSGKLAFYGAGGGLRTYKLKMDAKLDSGSKPEYFRPKYKNPGILQTHHDKPSQIGRFVPDFTGARIWNK